MLLGMASHNRSDAVAFTSESHTGADRRRIHALASARAAAAPSPRGARRALSLARCRARRGQHRARAVRRAGLHLPLAQAYAGRPPSLRAAYRGALRRPPTAVAIRRWRNRRSRSCSRRRGRSGCVWIRTGSPLIRMSRGGARNRRFRRADSVWIGDLVPEPVGVCTLTDSEPNVSTIRGAMREQRRTHSRASLDLR
jgi:hypothetical protein